MKSRLFSAYFVLFLGLLSSCQNDIVEPEQSVNSRTVTVTARLSSMETKVSLTQEPEVLNMVSLWEEGDKFIVFVDSGETLFELPLSTISNVTEDGKKCTFSYTLPENFPMEGYRIVAFSRVPGYTGVSRPTPHLAAFPYSLSLPITRGLGAVIMCDDLVQNGSPALEFKHISAYEVLHFSNTSSQQCTIIHDGFESESPNLWYTSATYKIHVSSKMKDELILDKDRNISNFEIIVNPGETRVIVSSFFPIGEVIKDNYLKLRINGESVKSSNTKSSYVRMRTGMAYHLYASWNRDELNFHEPNVDDAGFEGGVDLGLSVRWASCNIGASSPEDIGEYYAWGETTSRNSFSWLDYKYQRTGSGNNQKKYNGTDELTMLEPNDDIVHQIYGGQWRMPTKGEWDELQRECIWTPVREQPDSDFEDGQPNTSPIIGYNVASKTKNTSIYIPCGGFNDQGTVKDPQAYRYWTTTLADRKWQARTSGSDEYYDYGYRYGVDRCLGLPIRGVYDDCDDSLTEGEFVNMGLSVKWASYNMGADKPEEIGNYYAWGETTPKESYSWDTYSYSNDGTNNVSKYNGTDGIIYLEWTEDVVHKTKKGSWRTPTKKEWDELQNPENCEWTEMYRNGIRGYKVKSKKTGESIFIPTAGYMDGAQKREGMAYRYWTSSVADRRWQARTSGSDEYYDYGYRYGFDRRFGMPIRGVYDSSAQVTSGESVNMGLSVEWASHNVGAVKPSDFGTYYAWGETVPRLSFDWKSYGYSFNASTTMTKYNSTDNLLVLEEQDDVAAAKMKDGWRMPTKAEWDELWNNCDKEEKFMDGHYGYVFTSKINGKKLFIPIAGYKEGILRKGGTQARYWTSSVADRRWQARTSGSDEYYDYGYRYGFDRCIGMPIRAVRD